MEKLMTNKNGEFLYIFNMTQNGKVMGSNIVWSKNIVQAKSSAKKRFGSVEEDSFKRLTKQEYDNMIDEEKSKEIIPPEKKQEINQYYDLGNHLRFSICHGYPEIITKSSKELCHNGEISKIYLSDPKNVNSIYRRNFFFL
jgi:hypothetical protein